MTIPRFDAEASLYKTSGHYRLATGRFSGLYAEQVRPQFFYPRRGGDWCIPGCICVSPIGCPCCDSLFPTFPTPMNLFA